MKSELDYIVSTNLTMPLLTVTATSNQTDWRSDCQQSPFAWWTPLLISVLIYVVNFFYLGIKFCVIMLRKQMCHEYKFESDQVSSGYSNIFKGINQQQYVNTDHEFELEEYDDEDDDSICHISNTTFRPCIWPSEDKHHYILDENIFFRSTASVMELKQSIQPNSEEKPDSSPIDCHSDISKKLSYQTLNPENRSIEIENLNALAINEPKLSMKKFIVLPENSVKWVAIARFNLKVRTFCERLTSVSYQNGRLLLTIYVFLCTISWIMYIIGTIDLYMIESTTGYAQSRIGRQPLLMEGLCLTTGLNILIWIDFVNSLYFLGYFILKLGASTNRSTYSFKIASFVDIITIPNALMAIGQTRYHIDMGFLRAINIFNYGEVLSYMGILSSNRVIQTINIFFTMFAMWMVASGMIHSIIHIGDFWKTDHGALIWSYLDCCYFLLVTMSTVGYGDYSPSTITGKLFICIFIPVAMGIFAVFVPELFRNFSAARVDSETFTPLAGQQHVVVCGNFTNFSLHMILKGFFHSDHNCRRRMVNMVILRVAPIDLAMKAMLTKYNAWVKYCQGTPNDPRDLARVSLFNAQGIIVLATPNSQRRNHEDGINIMQAIALKAQSSKIRVLVQLHHFRNKSLLENFPRWTSRNKDNVFCMDEIKLGLLALNALAPGFATIILNLLNGHRMKHQNSKGKFEKWRVEYDYGAAMELYDVTLSHEFNHLSAQELALFVYEKWDVLLLAINIMDSQKMRFIINPASHKNLIIDVSSMKAVVIATNSDVVNNLQKFCTMCKAHETGLVCRCPKRLHSIIKVVGNKRTKEVSIADEASDENDEASSNYSDNGEKADTYFRKYFRSPYSTISAGELPNRFTISPVNSPNESTSRFSRATSFTSDSEYFPIPMKPYLPKYVDSTGSFHWVPDTQISKITLTPYEAARYQFKNHYLLCIVGPILDELFNLSSFVFPLRFHWMELRDIVVLGNTKNLEVSEWTRLKNLPNIFLVQGNPCSLNDLNAVRLLNCASCTILGESLNNEGDDHCLQDKDVLFCAMTIRTLLSQSPKPIPMITELHYEENAHHFSSSQSHSLDFKLPLRFQESFARGIIFSNTLLYSSISSLYFSGTAFQFLRVLISGTEINDIEAILDHHNGLQKGHRKQNPNPHGNRVSLLKTTDHPFNSLFTKVKMRPLRYKDLFARAIMCWRILCVGLYRLDRRGFRVVITNPNRNSKVRPNDEIFCFFPVNQDWAQKKDFATITPSAIIKQSSLN